MEAESLALSLELVSGSGLGLSPEQCAALRSSLLLLQRDLRLCRVRLWGKVLGVRGDYVIAQGNEGPDLLQGRKSFYSLNYVDWCLLPPATDSLIAETQVVKGRFIGDPAHEYEHIIRRKSGEGESADEEELIALR
uniref:Radial spoke head protein 9 homolog n=1 Tax=Xenopus laevis TaxID=8355 RepID=Q3KPU3_XENLA|nr:MGC131317 protein [Xenopus laevis]